MREREPAKTRYEKDFDRAAEKEMRKQAAKTVEQHKDELADFPKGSIFKGPLY